MDATSDPSLPLHNRNVVLGISGGIAAYKAAELTRLLRKAGASVRVIMTHAAQQFVTPLLLQTLSGNAVATELFDRTQESEIGHINLADSADLLVIAPATADVIAKLSLGLASDLLSTVALACQAPLVICPAMNVNMWNKPQVQQHIAQLRSLGAHIVGPAAGELACGWVGQGRMTEPSDIVLSLAQIVQESGPRDLVGKHIVVTAGPTYEAIDPVRFIGNRSSGKMGFALAESAARRGAQVTLVAGPVALETPRGVTRKNVESAREMAQAVLPLVEQNPPPDCIVMAAAVADHRPSEVSPH
ncbi:MAG TPA: bifunctional phosphopantothenoylcysteine decarboxylase/phosphopantothenate--cysteine ligase CoaBC, partial [Pseudomonadota bacterium]|nr:bifunctional phosphopantothenoylcysteine decarboxylase/phosphopantothenate--cysteine ligase CoaBC [Pseudomonadota bacterium]